MKKIIKSATAVLLAFSLCFVFCSCASLDRMKDAQGFYKDENREEIFYHDHNYKRISEYDNFENSVVVPFLSKCVWITESDVPVLLSELLGECFSVTENATVLYNGQIYCREDKYDEVREIVTNSELSSYGFKKYNQEKERQELIILDEEAKKSIDETLSSGITVNAEEIFREDAIDIMRIDSTGLIGYYAFLVEICKNADGESKYFLTSTENETGRTTMYKIPDEYDSLWKDITDKYCDSYYGDITVYE